MKKVIIPLMFWGVIMFSLTLLFGMNTVTFLQRVNIGNNLVMYKIDTFKYLQNLTNSFSTISQLTIETPTRQWINISSNILQEQFWQDLGNNLALMLDWILFGLNIFIYLFRIGGYNTLQILAIFGINTVDNMSAGGLNWLVVTAKFLRDLTIPYV